MDKQQIEAPIKYEYNWEYSTDIDEAIKDLNKMKELGATHINIEATESYDCAYMEFRSHCERLETDEEVQHRLDQKEAREYAKRMNDLNTIELLKKRHGIE